MPIVILSGGDLKDAKEMIGHRDLKMTDRYAHLTSMRKLSRQEDLARFYANSEETREPSPTSAGTGALIFFRLTFTYLRLV